MPESVSQEELPLIASPGRKRWRETSRAEESRQVREGFVRGSGGGQCRQTQASACEAVRPGVAQGRAKRPMPQRMLRAGPGRRVGTQGRAYWTLPATILRTRVTRLARLRHGVLAVDEGYRQERIRREFLLYEINHGGSRSHRYLCTMKIREVLLFISLDLRDGPRGVFYYSR